MQKVGIMAYFTYRFDATPCWAVATNIPEPKRKQGIQQILAGVSLKNTPLILYNHPDILKYIMVEKDGQPIQLRQMLGGIAIVDKFTLIAALKTLKTWLGDGARPEIAFFQTRDAAEKARDLLLEKMSGYQDALMADIQPRAPELHLDVIDFAQYIREAIAKYGDDKSIEQLLEDTDRAQNVMDNKPSSKFKSLFNKK